MTIVHPGYPLKLQINPVQLKNVGKFSSKPVDVWGISDKDLFMEANKVLAKQDKPFFAIVQTADNHRPFTIPEADRKLLSLKNYITEEGKSPNLSIQYKNYQLIKADQGSEQ